MTATATATATTALDADAAYVNAYVNAYAKAKATIAKDGVIFGDAYSKKALKASHGAFNAAATAAYAETQHVYAAKNPALDPLIGAAKGEYQGVNDAYNAAQAGGQ
mgnify:CR=1 FL=1